MKRVKGYSFGEGGKLEYPQWVANSIRNGKFLTAKFVTLESFDRLKYLAEGTSCKVELARDKESGKYYVLKGVRKSWMFRTERAELVRRQLEVHSTICHRYVINFFRVFDNHSFVYIVQEYCLGGTLEMMLRDRALPWQAASISVEAAKFYVAEIASALNYLHRTRNIIYRNLLPENVGLSWNGHVKLLGFGKAVVVDPDDPFDLSSNDDVYGNIEALAPELMPPRLTEPFLAKKQRMVAVEDNELEERYHSYQVDWWALGVLLHRLVLGYYPFGDSKMDSESDICKAVLYGKRVTRLTTGMFERREASTGVVELIHNLLQIDMNTRWEFEEIKICQFMHEIADWSLLHYLQPPNVPKYALVEADTSCFKSSQKRHKKAFKKPGVFPEELREHPTKEEISYGYYSHVVKEVMTDAFLSHTVKTRQCADEALANLPTLQNGVKDSEMFQKLQNGMSKKQQRDQYKKQLRNAFPGAQ